MRWFVDVSTVGKAAEKKRYCVEAESWQRALQAARDLRDDPGPMTGFSVELLDDGFSAVDPIKRQRYAIKKAGPEEPLTVRGSIPPAAPAPSPKASSVPPPAPDKAKKTASSRPPAVEAKAPEKATSIPPPAVATKAASVPPPADGPVSRPPPSKSSTRPPAPDLNLSPKGSSKGKSTPAPPIAEVISPSVPPPAPAPAVRASVPPAAPSVPPAAAAAPSVRPAALTQPDAATVEVLAKREQDPGAEGPLTYREYAYFTDASPSNEEAERVLRAQLDGVRASISTARAGKLVNLALFDVRFTGRPPKLPLVTLTWKDWREEPVITFPTGQVVAQATPQAAPEAVVAARPSLSDDPSTAAAKLLSTATIRMTPEQIHPFEGQTAPASRAVPEAAPDVATEAAPAVSESVATPVIAAVPQAPTERATEIVAAVASPAPSELVTQPMHTLPAPPPEPEPDPPPAPVSGPPESKAPPTTRASGFPGAPVPSVNAPRRLRGDELIADLFEAMHDLQFLRDAIEGADFCLTLALEKMPARGGIVHLYDIDHRQFVITCAGGPNGSSLLNQRSAENDPVLFPTMRRRRALVLPDATSFAPAKETPRYATLGGAKSLIVAPVALGGRFLGAIELLNPMDDIPFTDDDGHALSYIAEQLAAFVGQRGILLNRDSVPPSAPASAAQRGRSGASTGRPVGKATRR